MREPALPEPCSASVCRGPDPELKETRSCLGHIPNPPSPPPAHRRAGPQWFRQSLRGAASKQGLEVMSAGQRRQEAILRIVRFTAMRVGSKCPELRQERCESRTAQSS